jgi:DNA-binding MarR family transcriptional regulator
MACDYRMIVDRMTKLNIIHRIFLHRALAESGLFFGQLPILQYIAEHNNCTQKQLADTLQVSAPSIATSIKRMQKSGLLKKTTDEGDLRCNRISITEKGQELVALGTRVFDVIDQRMLQGFSEKECEELLCYLDRLIKNLESDEFRNKSMFALMDTMLAEKQRLCEQKGEVQEHD